MSDEQPIQFHVSTLGNELIIRQGSAPDIHDPESHVIVGGAGTIKSYVDKRRNLIGGLQGVNTATDYILVEPKKLRATLYIQPENHFSWTVSSELKRNEFLEAFGINKGKKFSRKEIMKLVKYNAHLFANVEEVSSILGSLQNLKVDAQISNEQSSDNRANASKKFQKSVYVDLLSTFVLQTSLYQYTEPRRFIVELCFETTDTDILFWLESSELAIIESTAAQEIFEEEFESLSDFLIIYS